MDGLRMRCAGKEQGLIISVQATLIRLSNDFGRILGNLRRLHVLGITERFDYFMTGEHILYERKIAFSKFVLLYALGLCLFLFFK